MKKFLTFVFVFIISFLNINMASASERKIKVGNDKSFVELPCPNKEGMFQLRVKMPGVAGTATKRCYATVRGEVGAWLPLFWGDGGAVATGGIYAGLQYRIDPELSLRLSGGFGFWKYDETSGVTWHAQATARIHVLDDVLRLGVGLGITQQHVGFDSKIADFVGGGVIELELELSHHLMVNAELTLGAGGEYDEDIKFSSLLALTAGYRF